MFFEDIRSERLLMTHAADRLSVRWYLGYDLSEPLPDHSSLSRIRTRYGVEVFRRFFEKIVEQCQQEKLVWGKELYIDGTQVNANAEEKGSEHLALRGFGSCAMCGRAQWAWLRPRWQNDWASPLSVWQAQMKRFATSPVRTSGKLSSKWRNVLALEASEAVSIFVHTSQKRSSQCVRMDQIKFV
jgi:hypothetical protein